ncbi:DMT family transporter [Psychrobacter sp. FDAARGOS_221]|uniref:DMT family transporter n=1 Tax=Psychrobacter sp. FDAARGOS_221 TaxID=1975705 RepID=UPI000BB570E4|nr:DMT family transporter [Psychrobacter sp. FDAARGOS_221]PNK59506.1 EamA/RhaT family transporter [Psychrobacter sp. FDAARGOS_221]
MTQIKTYSIFIFLAFIWGASFIFMRVGVPEFSAPVFGGLRVGLAGIAMLPILLKPSHFSEFKANWLKLSLIGTLSTGAPFMLYAFALGDMNAGTGAVINASVPMMTGLIAYVFFKEALTKWQILGLIIGLFGVILLMYNGMTSGTQTSMNAFAMAIGACVCYAIGGNLAKHYLSGIKPLTIASSGLVTSGLLTLPIVIFYFPAHSISWQAWGSAIMVALFSTAVAMVLFYQLIQAIGPTKTTVVTLLIPVFAILLGFILLNEKLSLMMLVGAIVVLSGTSLTMFAKPKILAKLT